VDVDECFCVVVYGCECVGGGWMFWCGVGFDVDCCVFC